MEYNNVFIEESNNVEEANKYGEYKKVLNKSRKYKFKEVFGNLLTFITSTVGVFAFLLTIGFISNPTVVIPNLFSANGAPIAIAFSALGGCLIAIYKSHQNSFKYDEKAHNIILQLKYNENDRTKKEKKHKKRVDKKLSRILGVEEEKVRETLLEYRKLIEFLEIKTNIINASADEELITNIASASQYNIYIKDQLLTMDNMRDLIPYGSDYIKNEEAIEEVEDTIKQGNSINDTILGPPDLRTAVETIESLEIDLSETTNSKIMRIISEDPNYIELMNKLNTQSSELKKTKEKRHVIMKTR